MEKKIVERFENELGRLLFYRNRLIDVLNEEPPEECCPWCSTLEKWANEHEIDVGCALEDYLDAIDNFINFAYEDYEVIEGSTRIDNLQ